VGACGFEIHLAGTEDAVGIFRERALENSGHVFGQQRPDGD
jgi:hypothetical protein